jgi:hypothetical protein
MKPVLMRAVACEWVLCALLLMAASAQRAQTDLTNLQIEDQQAQLRSNVNLPWHWEWTTSAYFVGRLAAPKIASYTRLDVNLVCHLSDKMWLGVVGQNLLQALHQEYAGGVLTVTPSLVRRSGYARLTWRF